MTPDQVYMVFDYETRGEDDLKRTGAWEYSLTAEILCVAYRIGTKATLAKTPVKCYSPFFGPKLPNEFIAALENPKILKVARNALFEQVITRHALPKYVEGFDPELCADPASWVCTASMAAALALPRSLEGACSALSLPIQKDMEGRRLILKYCKPRKATKHNPDKWHRKLSELKRIMQYCVTDVEADTAFFLAVPDLTPFEREVWILDQKINLRGIRVDREMVETVLRLVKEELAVLGKRFTELTGIASPNQRAKLLEWLALDGHPLPDLKAKTVEDSIKNLPLSIQAKKVLQIRQAFSKTSTAKYEAFDIRSRSDGFVRDLVMYHGASTGRFTGTGVQLQNLPRGTVKDSIEEVDLVKSGDLGSIRLVHKSPMDLFSSCIRNVIQAREGTQFYCGDFSSIEVRVLFWCADHAAGLRAYEEDRDLYCEQARDVYRRDITKEDKKERQLGKKLILGAGYGLGHKRFLESCGEDGIPISPLLAKIAIDKYRERHSPIPTLWNNLETAAIRAVRNPGKRFKINHTVWFAANNFLWCELPSGRKLAYYHPTVKFAETSWGSKKETLFHYGVNPKTKKWEEQKTWGGTLTENVVQAIARDLMVYAMLRLEKAGYKTTIHVHDELLTEHLDGDIEIFKKLMALTPSWAEGLPVKVDAWVDVRYHK